MAEQVLDRDRLRGGDAGIDADRHVGKGRQMLGDRVGEEQAAFFVEDHRGHADDRLGHGINAEDRIGAHGRAGGLVAEAEAFEIGDLAMAGDGGDGASSAVGLRKLSVCPVKAWTSWLTRPDF